MLYQEYLLAFAYIRFKHFFNEIKTSNETKYHLIRTEIW